MKSNYVWLNDKSFTVCEFLKLEFWGMILRKYGRHADESSPKRNRSLQPLMDGKIMSDEWYSVVSREVRNKLYEIEWMKG